MDPMFEDRKSTRLNSSHTVIYTLSLHDALPIFEHLRSDRRYGGSGLTVARSPTSLLPPGVRDGPDVRRSEEHTSELQSHSDLHSFPTRRSSDLRASTVRPPIWWLRPDGRAVADVAAPPRSS